MKPFIVFTGAKKEITELIETYKGKCFVAFSCNVWMNEELVTQYLKGMIGKFSFARRLLI